MAPRADDSHVIDKADSRLPHIILRRSSRIPPVSFSLSNHSVNIQLSLLSPANPTKPFNMSVATQSLGSAHGHTETSRAPSVAGSLPSSVQQTLGVQTTIDGPIDTFVLDMKKELLEKIKDASDNITHVQVRVEKVEGRLDKVEERLGAVEGRLGAVEGRLGAVEDGLKDLRDDVNKRFAAMQQQLDRIEALLTDRQPTAPQPQQDVRITPQPIPISATHLAPPSAPYTHATASSPSLRSKASKMSIKSVMKRLVGARAKIDGAQGEINDARNVIDASIASLQVQDDAGSPTSPTSPATPTIQLGAPIDPSWR